VLAFAGVTKLRSPGTLVTAAEGLGLSPLLARFVDRFLAPLELAIAALLLASATAWIGAVAALILFGGFSALIAWNLRRGQRPACACFGEASSEPISEWTLVRNVFFGGLALVVVAQGPAGVGPGVFALTASLVGRVGLGRRWPRSAFSSWPRRLASSSCSRARSPRLNPQPPSQ